MKRSVVALVGSVLVLLALVILLCIGLLSALDGIKAVQAYDHAQTAAQLAAQKGEPAALRVIVDGIEKHLDATIKHAIHGAVKTVLKRFSRG